MEEARNREHCQNEQRETNASVSQVQLGVAPPTNVNTREAQNRYSGDFDSFASGGSQVSLRRVITGSRPDAILSWGACFDMSDLKSALVAFSLALIIWSWLDYSYLVLLLIVCSNTVCRALANGLHARCGRDATQSNASNVNAFGQAQRRFFC
jgi:hypothetical protein